MSKESTGITGYTRGHAKEGVVGTILGVGALSHIGSNLLMKATKNTGAMRRFRANQFAEGVRRGVEGRPTSTWSRVLGAWAGPELSASQELGHVLGRRLREVPKENRLGTLAGLSRVMSMAPKGIPTAMDVGPGLRKVLVRGLPESGVVRQPGFLSRMAPWALAPLAVAEPGILGHVGINWTRRAVANSKQGRTFMNRQFVEGLGGLETPAWKKHLVDTLVSPHALDTRRAGLALRKTYGTQINLPRFRSQELEGVLEEAGRKGTKFLARHPSLRHQAERLKPLAQTFGTSASV